MGGSRESLEHFFVCRLYKTGLVEMETFADTEDTRLESYKKTAMPKKKVFAARTLQDCLPNLPLETGKAKKKIKDFL